MWPREPPPPPLPRLPSLTSFATRPSLPARTFTCSPPSALERARWRSHARGGPGTREARCTVRPAVGAAASARSEAAGSAKRT
jgi:hypothetical protein